MDIVLKQTLEALGKSPTPLIGHNTDKIKTLFPVPKEQKILWADVSMGRRPTGLVLTNQGLFIKGSSHVLKRINEKKKKKEKVNSIYHYVRWEYFSPEDFVCDKNGEVIDVSYNNSLVLELTGRNFFKTYTDTYTTFVKESAVSAADVFADVEAVMPEQHAAINFKYGHGEMAEEALNIIDKFQGKDAKILGRDNAPNGPDRVVDGQFIQVKYHNSGTSCINNCFNPKTGAFRYVMPNGEPMLIEVPKDVYADAVQAFREKIIEGKIPGVTNPDDAAKYIKQGKLTYQQALNLCKPGTLESLSYDAATGAITCTFAFGITFLCTFALSMARSKNCFEAVRSAFAASIQVFGLSFVSHVLAQQVARTSLTHQLIPLSSYIVTHMGYKAVQTVVNSIRAMMGKRAISGAAATKQLAKILRSNVVTSTIAFVVFSLPDTYNVFSRKISGAQYTKNMLSLIGSFVSAGGGTLGASVLAAKVGAAAGTTITPGVGTAIGAAGGVIGGVAGGTVIKLAGDAIREDDTVILSRLFNGVIFNLMYEYLLTEEEIDQVINKLDHVKHKEFKKLFQRALAAGKQEKVFDDFVRPICEDIIKQRKALCEPRPADIIDFVEKMSTKVLALPAPQPT